MTATSRSGGAIRLLVLALTAFLLVAFTPMRLGFIGLASADDGDRRSEEDARLRENDDDEVRSEDDDDDDDDDDDSTGDSRRSGQVQAESSGTGRGDTATNTGTESKAVAGVRADATADSVDTTGDQKTAATTNSAATGPATSAVAGASAENGTAFESAAAIDLSGDTADTTGTNHTNGTDGTKPVGAADVPDTDAHGDTHELNAENAAASSPIGEAEVGLVAAGMFLALAGSGYALNRRRRNTV